MKRLGLVGGVGPASTLDYYNGINNGYRARLGIEGNGNPPLMIDSIDLGVIYPLVAAQDWEPFAQHFVDALTRLAAAGCEVGAIAANTAHIVFDQIAAASPIPLVSIVQATRADAQRRGSSNVIVFGTGFTMKSGMYEAEFAAHGLRAVSPNPADADTIHNIIFPRLQQMILLPEDKAVMLEIAERMIEEEQADGLLLACTEIPLLIGQRDLRVEAYDTTQIHVDAILDAMLN